MTELAKKMIADGQAIRAVDAYLLETFQNVKGKNFNDIQINTFEDFLVVLEEVINLSHA